MMASTQRYRLFASLVSLAFVLLYQLVATGSARADDQNPAASPAVDTALQAVDEPVAAGSSLQASTDQAATATAAATQQQPRNLVVSIRIDSPGNDGPISQRNDAGSVAGASNDGSTGQGGAAGGQASQQQATTDQAATATATATQDQPQNIIIVIRINSPGDNGAIEQTNTTVAVSNAGNVSVTRQGGSGNGGAGETAPGASPDPQAAIGPPAQQESAPAPAGALPRMSVALLTRAAPKTAIAPGHRVDRSAPASRKGHRPAGDRTSSAPSSVQTVSSEPNSNLSAAVGSGAHESQTPVKPAHRLAPARDNGAAYRDPGVGRRALDFLGQLAPRTPQQASAGEKDVTNAVVFTLIAVLGAFVVFFGSTNGLRLLDPRSWRHR